MTERLSMTAALILGALALGACASGEHGHAARAPAQELLAVMRPASGSQAGGTVHFHAVPGGVRVVASIDGLSPGSRHAIHVHEKGDCSAPDATSAGGHYNPQGHPHAGPDSALRHAGDLGNLEADASGHAEYDRTYSDITLDGALNPVLGLAVIIHAGEDDLTTQPTGAAGGRIACGVIGLLK